MLGHLPMDCFSCKCFVKHDSVLLLLRLCTQDGAAAATAAGGGGGDAGELEGDAKDLREMLRQRDAQRIAAEEDLPWDEVEQPDTSDLEED